jgi:hypothetical protein
MWYWNGMRDPPYSGGDAVSESVELQKMSRVERDEASIKYEPPVLSEIGRFSEVTQGPGTQQAEGSSGFMV